MNKMKKIKEINEIITKGADFLKQNDSKNALDQYSLALEYSEKIKEKPLIITSKVNMGIIYQNRSLIEKALQIYEEVIQICDDINDFYTKSNVLHNIGKAYVQKGKLKDGIHS
ncbi:unnamed protein product [marine sediment metagenome]|uniref:Uncharacterized protein n=1 Tax=marine sediment metagenome TaxID=412755 RepID=X1A8Q7_9ZZZZ